MTSVKAVLQACWQICGKFSCISVCLSLCLFISLYGITRSPLDGFSIKFVLGMYLKLCWQYSNLVKITLKHQALYLMKQVLTHWNFPQYEKFFEKSCRENQDMQFLLNVCFGQTWHLRAWFEKYGKCRQATCHRTQCVTKIIDLHVGKLR